MKKFVLITVGILLILTAFFSCERLIVYYEDPSVYSSLTCDDCCESKGYASGNWIATEEECTCNR